MIQVILFVLLVGLVKVYIVARRSQIAVAGCRVTGGCRGIGRRSLRGESLVVVVHRIKVALPLKGQRERENKILDNP